MFPSLPTCFQMFPAQETFRRRHVETMFKDYSPNYNILLMKQNRQETVSATMFPSLPRDLLDLHVL